MGRRHRIPPGYPWIVGDAATPAPHPTRVICPGHGDDDDGGVLSVDGAPAIRLTWLGHATVLVEDRARVLTDPVLTARLLHLHRRAGETPAAPPAALDAVVVSHLHSDHLHLPSLRLLAPGTPVLVPRGSAGLLRRTGVEPIEVSAGDAVSVGGATITAVPARHAGSRWPWSRLHCAALGYVIEGNGATYFAGDTTAFPEMATLHPRLDVALLPVGGWGPWLRGGHLDPAAAALCLRELRPGVAVPVHYGTLWPTGLRWLRPRLFHQPGRTFAAHARVSAPRVEVRVVAPGASTTVRVASGRSLPDRRKGQRKDRSDQPRRAGGV
jgi:L-ascorbate metabolism protein UlaG (beta-lactamase superfamily)